MPAGITETELTDPDAVVKGKAAQLLFPLQQELFAVLDLVKDIVQVIQTGTVINDAV